MTSAPSSESGRHSATERRPSGQRGNPQRGLARESPAGAIDGLRSKARRVRALIVKETRQVLRDPSAIAIGIVLPVVLILLFGFGLSLDVKNVPLAVVLEDSSDDARELIGGLELSAYFRPRITYSMPAAEALMIAGHVDGIVRIPQDFSRRVRSEERRVGKECA